MNEMRRPDDQSIETIEPVAFVPSPPAERRARFGPWHILGVTIVSVVVGIFWFMFTSKSVQLKFTPLPDEVSISGGLSFELGGVWLLREGVYEVRASAELYETLVQEIAVGAARNQTIDLVFVPKPGYLTVTTVPADAMVMIDGAPVEGRDEIELPAGEHEVEVSHPRYQPEAHIVSIEGRLQRQTASFELAPNWADVEIVSTPPGGQIFIDDEPWPDLTPTVVEALAGERRIRVTLPGHKTHRQRIFAQAGIDMSLDPIRFVQADAQLEITSSPAGAGVLVGGRFVGETPITLDLKSGVTHEVELVRSGYRTVSRQVRLDRGESASLATKLERQIGRVVFIAEPADATLIVNGRVRGTANQTLELPVGDQTIEIRRDGHAAYKQTITPRAGLTQEVKVRLLTLEEARLAAMRPTITAPDGGNLILFKPFGFTMGASRREPGRRANETIRDVDLKRFFYLATHEVTNAQFRKFASGHDSGEYVEATLNDDEQPAVNLSWHDAAAYCNWLSAQAGLAPFYDIEFGKVQGFDPRSIGYRLPTEAEWSWAARTFDPEDRDPEGPELLKFPWGRNLPPPDRHGNYADRAATALVGRVLFGYNDNYAAAAPIGTFKANHRNLYDMGGNVAEWVHDVYSIPGPEKQIDPLGPQNGEYRVIKGSSWMHGTITELRFSFRDYGIDGRQDVGFRVARYAE